MHPMKRLRSLAAVVSGILLVLTVGFWVEGYWYEDMLAWDTGSSHFELASFSGRLSFAWCNPQPPGMPASPRRQWAWAGFLWVQNEWIWTSRSHHWVVNSRTLVHDDPLDYFGTVVQTPCWFPAALLAILPALWGGRFWLGRPRPGTCRSCGYDLRASRERCPECGAAIGSGASAGVGPVAGPPREG
jgi:hypothetical protein